MQVLDQTIILEEYVNALRREINPSDNYRQLTERVLYKFTEFVGVRDYRQVGQKEILLFLNSLRKLEPTDPLHKWIGTYNLYLIILRRFFKWFYNPEIEPNKRPKPEFMNGIAKLKRREKSIYKPTDLWTAEDDILFLKYCPSKRDRCYHMISRDSSCRPHEILKLKIKDVVFKMVGDKQYAEILVNGKTGQRHIPLINSITYKW
jgi:integrase